MTEPVIATCSGFDIHNGDPSVLLRRLQILAHRETATDRDRAECSIMDHIQARSSRDEHFCAVCGVRLD